jgi:hypothetical protein
MDSTSTDMSPLLRRYSGEVSYEVSVTNVSTATLRPLPAPKTPDGACFSSTFFTDAATIFRCENILRQARSFKDLVLATVLSGIKINTNEQNSRAWTQLQLQQ